MVRHTVSEVSDRARGLLEAPGTPRSLVIVRGTPCGSERLGGLALSFSDTGYEELLAQHTALSWVGHGRGPLGEPSLSVSECSLPAEVEREPRGVWAHGHLRDSQVFPPQFQVRPPMPGGPLSPTGDKV